ncbi:MAG TPA: hypothetical protein VH229_06915 [Candidatus Udaeobacter sp.]|nr:hypothetical protein [Candidatus Udaeobacter sp.]
MRLAGDDLPIAVALQPRVRDVITRFEILPEDRLGLVRVVTEYRRVADYPALGVLNVYGSGIPSRQRSDVGDQFRLVENTAFLVGEDAVVGEIFFPGRLITGRNGVVKLLGTMNQFVVRNRNICGAGERNAEKNIKSANFTTSNEELRIKK